VFNLPFLLIEFLDELVFGVNQAAWPLIRTDLRLSYLQIGLLLSVPGIVAAILEPLLGFSGCLETPPADPGRGNLLCPGMSTHRPQHWLCLFAGRLLFFLSRLRRVREPIAGFADGFRPGPARASHGTLELSRVARVVLSPLLLSGLAFISFGWRGIFIALAGLTCWCLCSSGSACQKRRRACSLCRAFRSMVGPAERPGCTASGEALRWLILLPFSDLMLDVLLGFLALYFVDVARLTPGQAALGIAVWSGLGLLGDFLLIPLLEKVRGLDYCG